MKILHALNAFCVAAGLTAATPAITAPIGAVPSYDGGIVASCRFAAAIAIRSVTMCRNSAGGPGTITAGTAVPYLPGNAGATVAEFVIATVMCAGTTSPNMAAG